MRRTRVIVSVAAVTTGLAVLSACGGATHAAVPTAGGKTKLAVATVGGLGEVLTEEKGLTLYRFDKDTANPSKSNCDNECATAWPPLLVGQGNREITGVDAKLVGKVTRTDGTEQVTVNDWPVYRFARDTKPGDAKGHLVGGTWFAVTAQGGKAAKTEVTPSEDLGSYGY